MDARELAAEGLEAFNAHDEARFRKLYADSAAFEAPGDVRLEGPDAITGYAMSWLNAFPDARLTIKNQLIAGDWVAEEFTFEGTHTDTLHSPDGDIPATNRSLKGRGTQIFRVENGKIADERLYFDQVQVLTQLGLMPQGATASA